MITNIRIRNFKGLKNTEFALGAPPVVLVGPNNCGKTSILQALTMWHVGASEWIERHSPRKNGGSLRGVSIPVGHFSALNPVNADSLWHKRETLRTKIVSGAKKPVLVPIQMDVSGESGGVSWNIGVEFLRRSRETVICRPISGDIPPEATVSDIAARWRKVLPQVEFVPPMSGMAWREDKLTPASIVARIGEGRTAEILRNLLYQALNPEGIFEAAPDKAEHRWNQIQGHIQKKFLVELTRPEMNRRGFVTAGYREDGCQYGLSSGGRGFHQTLLALTLLHMRPGGVFLLDEPDAHLEGVRQWDNLSMYSEIAEQNGSQLIVASHSEIVMKQAGPEEIVGVLRGEAVSLNDRKISEFKNLLTSIGWDKVVAAKIKGHIVFLEGSTDLDIFAALAKKIFGARGEEAAEKIRLANVEYVADHAPKAWEMFSGLRSGIPKLRGFALFDRDVAEKHPKQTVENDEAAEGRMAMRLWRRLEIENYIPLPEALYRYAEARDAELRQNESGNPETLGLPLPPTSGKTNAELMREAYESVVPSVMRRDRKHRRWRDDKMSAHIVDIMEEFSRLRGGKGAWSKRKCHTLVQYVEPDEIDSEVREKILALLKVIDPEFNPGEFR